MTLAQMSGPTLTIEEITYQMQLGIIESTFLGHEDHGVFTASLNIDFGSSGQGTPQHFLDTVRADGRERIGTAYGCQFIIELIGAVGVDQWEQLVGRRVYALREGYTGWIFGLANERKPETQYVLFKDIHTKMEGA